MKLKATIKVFQTFSVSHKILEHCSTTRQASLLKMDHMMRHTSKFMIPFTLFRFPFMSANILASGNERLLKALFMGGEVPSETEETKADTVEVEEDEVIIGDDGEKEEQKKEAHENWV